MVDNALNVVITTLCKVIINWVETSLSLQHKNRSAISGLQFVPIAIPTVF